MKQKQLNSFNKTNRTTVYGVFYEKSDQSKVNIVQGFRDVGITDHTRSPNGLSWILSLQTQCRGQMHTSRFSFYRTSTPSRYGINPCLCNQPMNSRRTFNNTVLRRFHKFTQWECVCVWGPFSLSCQVILRQNRGSDSYKHRRSGLSKNKKKNNKVTRQPLKLRHNSFAFSDVRHIGKYVHDNRVSVWTHSDPLYINRAGVLFMSQITLALAEEAAQTPALRSDTSNPNHTGQVWRCPRLPLPTLLPIIIIYSRIKGGFISKPMNNECCISKFNCPELNDSRWCFFYKFVMVVRGKKIR